MKNNFKRIIASIVASALCTVSTTVTSINAANTAYPRYTYRTVFTKQAQPVLNNQPTSIKNVVINYSVGRKGSLYKENIMMNPPKSLYSLVPNASSFIAGDKFYSCEGTFQAKSNTDNKRGLVCTISSVLTEPTVPNITFTAISKNNNGVEVDRNTQSVDYYGLNINEVNYKWSAIAVDTFLVGDLNGDKNVDNKDLYILGKAFDNGVKTSRNSALISIKNPNINIHDTVWVTIDPNTTVLLPVYKFDIDNNGFISNADEDFLKRYIIGSIPFFLY